MNEENARLWMRKEGAANGHVIVASSQECAILGTEIVVAGNVTPAHRHLERAVEDDMDFAHRVRRQPAGQLGRVQALDGIGAECAEFVPPQTRREVVTHDLPVTNERLGSGRRPRGLKPAVEVRRHGLAALGRIDRFAPLGAKAQLGQLSLDVGSG
jgi:hypothetical protein